MDNMMVEERARERLRTLLADGWYRPGESHPIISADADAWIKEVRELGAIALQDRTPVSAEVVEQIKAMLHDAFPMATVERVARLASRLASLRSPGDCCRDEVVERVADILREFASEDQASFSDYAERIVALSNKEAL